MALYGSEHSHSVDIPYLNNSFFLSNCQHCSVFAECKRRASTAVMLDACDASLSEGQNIDVCLLIVKVDLSEHNVVQRV